MNVLVIGTGNMGSAFVKRLTAAGHSVSVTARDAKKARRATFAVFLCQCPGGLDHALHHKEKMPPALSPEALSGGGGGTADIHPFQDGPDYAFTLELLREAKRPRGGACYPSKNIRRILGSAHSSRSTEAKSAGP